MQNYCIILGLLLSRLAVAQPISVMVDKMNVLHVGAPNDLSIVVSDIAANRLVVTVSQGEIVRLDTLKKSWHSTTDQSRYCWTIREMKSKQAWLVIADSTLENPIDTLFFRVKQLPEPWFHLVESSGVWGQVGDYCSEFLRATILSFDITFIPKGRAPIVMHNSGPRFSTEVLDYLNLAGRDWEVYIENITYTSGYDPSIRKSDQVLRFKKKKS